MAKDEDDYANSKPFILGINSSERKNGDTARSLERVLRRVRECGGRTELVHLVDLNLGPCEKCRGGQVLYANDATCPHADDTIKLMKAVLRADGIILATLVEWMGRAPLAAAFMAKLNALEERKLLIGKVGGIIVTYGQAESGVGNDLQGAFNDMGVQFPPFGVVRRSALSKAITFNRLLEKVFVQAVGKRLNGELDGLNRDFSALAENVVKKIKLLKECGAEAPNYWN